MITDYTILGANRFAYVSNEKVPNSELSAFGVLGKPVQ